MRARVACLTLAAIRRIMVAAVIVTAGTVSLCVVIATETFGQETLRIVAVSNAVAVIVVAGIPAVIKTITRQPAIMARQTATVASPV